MNKCPHRATKALSSQRKESAHGHSQTAEGGTLQGAGRSVITTLVIISNNNVSLTVLVAQPYAKGFTDDPSVTSTALQGQLGQVSHFTDDATEAETRQTVLESGSSRARGLEALSGLCGSDELSRDQGRLQQQGAGGSHQQSCISSGCSAAINYATGLGFLAAGLGGRGYSLRLRPGTRCSGLPASPHSSSPPPPPNRGLPEPGPTQDSPHPAL